MKFQYSAVVFSLTGLLIVAMIAANTANAHDGIKGISSYNGQGVGSASGIFESKNVQLLSQLELTEIGASGASVFGSDIWGWSHGTGAAQRRFALMGLTNATSFVEVTDPFNPVYLGKLDTHEAGQNRAWRDIKVYQDHAYIVADGNGNDQGVQAFDLNQLLTADQTSPTNFAESFHYDGLSSSHNIAINEDTGFAYVTGARNDSSNGGLHVLDLRTTGQITQAGVFSAGSINGIYENYSHDAQAVVYNGPDAAHVGKEVVFGSNENSLVIADVTDKSAMSMIGQGVYETQVVGSTGTAKYAHQGWLSEDQKYFFMDDELDEFRADQRTDVDIDKTRTFIWDVQDLENPFLLSIHEGTEFTIDHNQYTHNGLLYQANYTSGMRILKMTSPGVLEEIAFFDTYNLDNSVDFEGAWSVFPYFEDGTILVSDINGGLFALRMVPEPSSGLLIGLGMLGCFMRRRKNKV